MNIIAAYRRRVVGAAVLLGANWVPTGCTDGSPEAAHVEATDSAGVSLVRSLSPDVPLSLESEVVFELGGEETPEESFYAVNSTYIGTDGSGNLYALDRDAHQVQVFDSTGSHLRTMGREGGGPGELQFPWALVTADDGRGWVVDIGKRALVGWGPDGEVLPEEPLPERYFGGAVKWTSSGLVFPLRDLDGSRLELVGATGESDVLAALAPTEPRTVQLTSCGMSFSNMEPIFAPYLVWTVSGTRVPVARNPDYVVDVYEAGQLVRSLRRDLPSHPATEELAVESLGDGWRVGTEGGERVCDPREVVEQLGFARYLPMVAQLAYSPDGTLWVQRYSVGSDPAPIDVFDPNGRYLGTLPEDSPFPIGFLPDGRILVSETDELDVQRLVVRTAEFGPP